MPKSKDRADVYHEITSVILGLVEARLEEVIS
jgi:hypothetical protein